MIGTFWFCHRERRTAERSEAAHKKREIHYAQDDKRD